MDPNGGTFPVSCEVRSGSVCGLLALNNDYDFNSSGRIPAGRVGVWAGSDSAAVKADNFRVRSLAGRNVVDGRFFDDYGNVRVSGGKLEFYNSDGARRQTVLEPVRMGKGVVQADLTYRANVDAGFIVHYQGPEDFMAVVLYHDGSSLVYVNLYQSKDGATGNLVDWDGGFTMTDNTPYTLKCVIDDDPNNIALQRLRSHAAADELCGRRRLAGRPCGADPSDQPDHQAARWASLTRCDHDAGTRRKRSAGRATPYVLNTLRPSTARRAQDFRRGDGW